MGVYINMETPKDCIKCRFCLFTGVYWKCLVDGSHADFGGTCRPSECPLVPVPPHGRLIDADALCASHKEVCSRSMKFNLDLAQTVIPASESKERPAFLPQYELTPRSEEG